ncbi:proprotein convertase P-domain-containing protein [Vibrio sp. Of7-15]|uniref:proprotein convertase P-domain-containing protein n=1 Tax=Vibrio sp. Of7-15 TaxID=2724879 RepID=UPI001EF33F3A|nr:proprotein convertase P-domain-containing protein [Vibrio sp. Of7-15]MCG7497177.1 proprotein convertase P-domain-containing protein [Vibrio sp. Of7-15]
MKKPLTLTLASLVSAALGSASVQAGEWDYPAQAVQITDAAQAKTYLNQHYPEAGELTLRYTSNSALGTHYNFNITLNGEYKQQRTLVLSTDKSNMVSRVYKSLEDTIVRNGVATKAAELEAPRTVDADLAPSIGSGSLVDHSINVISPDLRTMNQTPPPESNYLNVSDYPGSIHYFTKQAKFLESEGKLYLSNNNVKQIDIKQLLLPADEQGNQAVDPGTSFLPPEGLSTFTNAAQLAQVDLNDEANFLQLMAFYHLDKSIDYLKSLNFDVFQGPLLFDAKALSTNNSSYYIGAKTLAFGIGGSPDALDADIILHELGHAINHHITPDWAYGHSDTIGEGFGDYWAGAYGYQLQYEQGTSFELDTVFNWDGYFGHQRHTRSLNNQKARYYPTAEYRAHESVGGELGDELWSTPLFQTLKQGVALYGADAFNEVNTIILESFYGLGRGVKMDDLAENILYVAGELYPNRDYQRLFKAHFYFHGLLRDPFEMVTQSVFIPEGTNPAFSLVPTKRKASINAELSSNLTGTQTIQNAAFDKLDITYLPNQEMTCGQEVTVSANINYQFNDNLLEKSTKLSKDYIYGTPILSHEPSIFDSIIPDAQTDSSGRAQIGFKTFNFYINDNLPVIDDNFAVQLHLTHSQITDLDITLVSPNGERISLVKHQQVYSDTINTTYLLSHMPELAALKGSPITGAWRLEISDHSQENSGKLLSWGVGNLTKFACGPIPTIDSKVTPDNGTTSGGSSSLFGLFALLACACTRLVNLKKKK